jgi:hypothetical protein
MVPIPSLSDPAEAIERYPVEAAEALLAMQPYAATPTTLASLVPVAEMLNRDLADVAREMIEAKGWRKGFIQALKARGVPIKLQVPDALAARLDDVELAKFLPKAQAFRCRVQSGPRVGSGCLIGPSLVMTCWHVVAAGPPPAPLATPITVRLSDGRKRAVVGPPRYVSFPTDDEYAERWPWQDISFADRHDVVLLQLEHADGARLGFAELPAAAPELPSRSDFFLLDFPGGRSVGWTPGRTAKLRGITGRVGHDAEAAEGSSGGACFNTRFQMIGLHQGRMEQRRRLVPVSRFLDAVSTVVRGDVAPTALWSLDGTRTGEIVIGRHGFFEAVAETTKPSTQARGIRLRRRDPGAQGTAGLSFSLRLLQRLLALQPDRHRLVRIAFDHAGQDLLAAIRLAAAEQGLAVPEATAAPGVRAGESTPEATLNDRARHLTDALNAAAGQRLFWMFFQTPTGGLSEPERFALEAVIGAALVQPALRVVLAGFETMTMPGEEFGSPGEAAGALAAGLIVEDIGWFSKADIRLFLQAAAKGLGRSLTAERITEMIGEATAGVPEFNTYIGYFDPQHVETVVRRLSGMLVSW